MNEAHELKAAARTAFDRAAPSYDAAAVVQREASACLCAFSDEHPAANEIRYIVDAGCGTGHALPFLRQRFDAATLIALDFSVAMLGIAGSSDAEVKPVCADIERLPLADASVDAVWSCLAVQWCTPAAVLSELRRVLTPGGCAWVATLGPQTLHELRSAFAQIDSAAHVIDFATPATWQKEAADAGLQLIGHNRRLLASRAPDLRSLLRDIKAVGAHAVGGQRRRRPLGRQAWRALENHYERWRAADGLLPATHDLLLFALKRPA